jgi:HK97 family phage major capsid protein
VFRAEARVVTSSGGIKRLPTNKLSTAFVPVAELGTYAEQDKKATYVDVSAKKFGAMLKYSYEVGEDSLISILDYMTEDLSIAKARLEDKLAFGGDGTSGSSGIVGLANLFQAQTAGAGGTWATDAPKVFNAGVKLATGATLASIVAGDIDALLAYVQSYSRNLRFYCSTQTYVDVFLRLMSSAQGATVTETSTMQPMAWRGIPIRLVDDLTASTVASSVPIVLADLTTGSVLSDTLGLTVEQGAGDTDWYNDVFAVKAKTRFDIKHHDAGNYNATPASRIKGSIAGLALKNS